MVWVASVITSARKRRAEWGQSNAAYWFNVMGNVLFWAQATDQLECDRSHFYLSVVTAFLSTAQF
jgi:hypothetical protein